MIDARYEVRVTSVYPSYKNGNLIYNKFRGVIVSGYSQVATARTLVDVYSTPNTAFPINPVLGQIWRAKGSTKKQEVVINQQDITIISIKANRLKLVSPSGDAWQNLVVKNVKGIGTATAKHIWDVVVSSKRHDLFELLGAKNRDYFLALKVDGRTFLNSQQVDLLIQFWQEYDHVDLIVWLIEKQFPADISRKFAIHYGSNAIDIIEDNPYTMLTFGASFEIIDTIARTTFGLELDDKKRLNSAIENALHLHSLSGHTRANYSELMPHVLKLLKNRDLAEKAFNISQHESYTYFLNPHTKEYHPTGLLAMEMVVSERLKQLSKQSRIIDDEFYQSLKESENSLGFSLVDSQKNAVVACYKNCLSVVTGGAGVGKTAVTKVIVDVLEESGETIILTALAGRAVMRLQEATERTAVTIASLLHNEDIVVSVNDSGGKFTLIIDESSMIDLPTLYKLFTLFINNIAVIFVGDPQQLPPIGAGLILHTLVGINTISVSNLTVPQRFGADTGIAEYSSLIGLGKVPESLNYKNIQFYNITAQAKIQSKAVELYLESPDDSQMLAATNNEIDDINKQCQNTLNADSPSLYCVFGDKLFKTEYKLNDPIIFTKNIWNLNIQNGKFGKIIEVSNNCKLDESGQEVPTIRGDSSSVFGKIEMEDGDIVHIKYDTLDHFRMAHCISTHKAQGSQFNRIIVLVNKIGMVDRDWLYTAITRAKDSVHIIGSENLFKKKVQAVSNASKRRTYLKELMNVVV